MAGYTAPMQLDSNAIFEQGGRNYGNEEFAVCACPNCQKIYLIECEVDTIYVDSTDLSKRFNPLSKERFRCQQCQTKFPRGAWVGKHAPSSMVVTQDQLIASDWHWILKQGA